VQVDLGIWNKLTWFATVLGIIAGVGLVIGSYVPLLKQNERMRAQIDALDSLIQNEEQTAKRLKDAIDAYQHDPRTVERLARERLYYARPGDVVIRYIQPVTNPPPGP